MLKKYMYACLLTVLTLFTYSCKKDIGNYSYHDINEVKFPVELNGKITAFVLGQLMIKPELSFTQDAAGDRNRYSYQWSYVENSTEKTLAITKDLDIFVNINPGTYVSFYKVTDNVTGVRFSKQFSLEIRNVYNEGWLLMNEVNGKAQLDMLSKQVDGQFLTINDLLAQANSALQLKGMPRLVYGYQIGALSGYGINLPYGLYLGTDQSVDRVNAETFEWLPKYNVKKEILDPDLPDDFHIDAIQRVRSDNVAYMITSNGNVYFNAPSQQLKYSQPLNYANDILYKVAPFIGANENFTSGITQNTYFYDTTNKRFWMHLSSFDAKLLPVADPTGNAAKLFSYTNTGKDLVYMTYVATGSQIYAIFKDPGTQKRYLARFKQTDATQLAFDEMISTDIDKAEHFAVSPDLGYIYYSVGSKVYQYDYYSTPKSKVVLDKGAAKVSLLKFHSYHAAKYTDGNKLLVCSYDPALPEGKNGKIEQFNILLGAAGLGLDKTYTGFGKVVSMHYRER